MPHNASHQGLHCLIRQKQPEGPKNENSELTLWSLKIYNGTVQAVCIMLVKESVSQEWVKYINKYKMPNEMKKESSNAEAK